MFNRQTVVGLPDPAGVFFAQPCVILDSDSDTDDEDEEEATDDAVTVILKQSPYSSPAPGNQRFYLDLTGALGMSMSVNLSRACYAHSSHKSLSLSFFSSAQKPCAQSKSQI